MKIYLLFLLLWNIILCYQNNKYMLPISLITHFRTESATNSKFTLLAHTNKKFRKLRRDHAQRKALLRALTTNLLKYGKIVTTEAKAKEARIKVDRIITYAKRHENNKQYAYRLIANYVYDRELAYNIVRQAPIKYKERKGGYTRLKLLLKSRVGDASRMALLELL